MDAETIHLPEKIGPYRVTGRLGRGGMGEVLRGYDDRLGRPIALKRILPDVGEPEKALRRFRAEARALAQLSHSAIVQVYDWEESEGQYWLVMELVEGWSLREILAEGPLPLDQALQITREVASGLAAAHDAGIVHRDLKAANVLVSTPKTAKRGPTKRGPTKRGPTKILDFGLAKAIRIEGSETVPPVGGTEVPSHTLTGEGHVVGTVTAMSPEQALGHEVDHRSDLFSLGILIYEMLSGVSPFKGGNVFETVTRVCSVREEPLHHLDPRIPEGLSRLVADLLEKEPARRPSDAHQVVEAIDQLSSTISSGVPPVESPSWNQDTKDKTLFDLSESFPPRSAERREGSNPHRRIRLAVLVVLIGLGAWGTVWWLESSVGEVSTDPPRAVAFRQPAAEPSVYELYQSGTALLEYPDRKGNIERAINDFQQALAEDQDSAPALAGLATAYRLDHDRGSRDPQRLEQALAAAERAVEIDEYLAMARVSLGWVYGAMGRYDDALRELERALEIEPSNGDALAGIGWVHEERGNYGPAEEYFSRAITARPGKGAFRTDLGKLYYRIGRYDKAAAAFQQHLELEPDNFLASSNLGATYYMQGRLSDAASQFQRALLIKPDSTLYANVGTIYFTQGLYAQAVSAFEKAIEAGGANDYLLWGNLGDARRWTPGREERAREAYLRALQLLGPELASRPRDPTLRTRSALYLAKRGDCARARDEADTFDHPSEDDGNAWYRLAVAHEVCGHRDEALVALEKALRARFPSEEVKRDPELLKLRQDVRYHQMELDRTASSTLGSEARR